MRHLTDKGVGAVIILHGGAGEPDQRGEGLGLANKVLEQIASDEHIRFLAGEDPLNIVQSCLSKMELCGVFTAGNGSLPQSDGFFRQTAAIMDGRLQRFSGVSGATNIVEASRLALALQSAKYRVLAEPGADTLRKQLDLKPQVPNSPRTLRFVETKFMQAPGASGRDTIGCVVRTASGDLVAGTSTGGLSLAPAGRLSDAATVAGTYASRWVAVSATGIGEEIIDDAVAARMDARVRDGMALHDASFRCYQEGAALSRDYGWISLSHDGNFAVGCLSDVMSFVVIDGRGVASQTFP